MTGNRYGRKSVPDASYTAPLPLTLLVCLHDMISRYRDDIIMLAEKPGEKKVGIIDANVKWNVRFRVMCGSLSFLHFFNHARRYKHLHVGKLFFLILWTLSASRWSGRKGTSSRESTKSVSYTGVIIRFKPWPSQPLFVTRAISRLYTPSFHWKFPFGASILPHVC